MIKKNNTQKMDYTYINNILDQHPIVLFMKGTPAHPLCGFSRTVSTILSLYKVDFHSIDILDNLQLRNDLKVFSNWPTFPQLYVGKELIGGCDIIQDLYETKKLGEILGAVPNPTPTMG